LDRKPVASAEMSDYHELVARAYDALEAARKLPHGPQRSEAMKKASVMRLAAEKTVKITATSNET
jgi:hypothetical protein